MTTTAYAPAQTAYAPAVVHFLDLDEVEDTREALWAQGVGTRKVWIANRQSWILMVNEGGGHFATYRA